MDQLNRLELDSVYLKRLMFLLLIIVCNIILFVKISFAGQINKGTLSLGGSSNINYVMTGREDGDIDDVKTLNFAMTGGYFVANNFEIELGFGFTHQDWAYYTSQSYSFIPMINYHFPITANTNFYAGVGISWSRIEVDYPYYDRYGYRGEDESFGYGVKLGFEFFISKNAAITLAASYWKFEYSYGDSVSRQNRLAIPQIGVKLYF